MGEPAFDDFALFCHAHGDDAADRRIAFPCSRAWSRSLASLARACSSWAMVEAMRALANVHLFAIGLRHGHSRFLRLDRLSRRPPRWPATSARQPRRDRDPARRLLPLRTVSACDPGPPDRARAGRAPVRAAHWWSSRRHRPDRSKHRFARSSRSSCAGLRWTEASRVATFAFAAARLASSSLGSSSPISSPFFTSEPSSTFNFTIRPLICGLTITSLPSTMPVRGISLPRGIVK